MSDVRVVEGVFQDLPVMLTKEETLDRSLELAGEIAGREVLLEQKKSSASEISAKINKINRRIVQLSLTVRDGKEMRSVECYRRFNYSKNSVETFRVDTGERVSSRAMTSEERQIDLPSVYSDGSIPG